jgi:hypothetical protein
VADPRDVRAAADGRLIVMPVLEPNPTGGNKKLLQMFGLIMGILVVIGIIATFAAKLG